MLRSLIGSLLPVAALAVRGKDDGSSRENAHDVWAINNNGNGVWFHLYHWISVESDGTKIWNGDINVNTKNSYRNLAYGFCMEILGTQEEDWDCQRVLIDAVPTGSMNKDPSQWRGV